MKLNTCVCVSCPLLSFVRIFGFVSPHEIAFNRHCCLLLFLFGRFVFETNFRSSNIHFRSHKIGLPLNVSVFVFSSSFFFFTFLFIFLTNSVEKETIMPSFDKIKKKKPKFLFACDCHWKFMGNETEQLTFLDSVKSYISLCTFVHR